MKLLDIDKALQICGSNNKYQKILFLLTVFTWFSVDFVSITFPLLEIQPLYECKDPKTLMYSECKEKDACKTTDYRETVIYNNIFSDFKLSCHTVLVMCIGVVYTVGVFLGAFIGSKFADTFGRKPVLMINNFLFSVSCVALTIAPSIYIIFGILFFIGLTCAGGTMITFLLLNESLAANKRSLYGTLVNSSFSVAGVVYFVSFQFINNWKIIAYISAAANVLSIILIMIYVIESPRYLYANQKYQKFFSSMHKLSQINGKSLHFLHYLKSDAIYIRNDNLLNEHNKTLELTDEADKMDNNKVHDNTDNNNKENTTENIGISFTQNSKNNINPNSESLLQNDLSSPSSGNSTKLEINQQINDIINKYNRLSDKEKHRDDQPFLSRTNTNPSSHSTQATEKDKSYGYSSLFKYKSVRTNFLINNLAWFYCCFVYYGISMDLKNFTGDVFTNGYVVYSAEAFSYLITGVIISLTFFGRVKTLTIMCVLNSISSALYFFIDIHPFNKIFLFSARFSITSIYSIMYIYSVEVYPTVIRAKGLGINILFARLGSILVPIIVEIVSPLLIFSALGLIVMVFSLFLPETLNKELEDDIEEEKKKVDAI